MHRFFLENEDVLSETEIILYNEESVNHLVRVLRVKTGEQVELVDAKTLIIGNVMTFTNEFVRLSIDNVRPHENESRVQIDLYQCLPKGQKLELILQKNVELGVHGFYLVASKRCIVDYKPKDVPKKMDRLSKIVKEASKQSKRDLIPQLHGILSFNESLEHVKNYDQFLILYEREDAESLKSRLNDFNGERIAIFIGPEGGLDQTEVDALVSKGALSTTLGKRILRTETAGFVAVSCVQYEMDALG